MAVPRGAEPTITDGSGRFELKPLRPDRDYRVEAHQSGYDQRERATAKPGGEPLKDRPRAPGAVSRPRGLRGRLADPFVPRRRQEVTSPDSSFELPLPTEAGRVFAVVEALDHQPNMVDAPADQRDSVRSA